MAAHRYIYCMSSAIHPGIYKVDFSNQDPRIICDEANVFEHMHPYVLEFAKQVATDEDTQDGVRHCLDRQGSQVGEEAKNHTSAFWKIRLAIVHEILMCVPGAWLVGNGDHLADMVASTSQDSAAP